MLTHSACHKQRLTDLQRVLGIPMHRARAQPSLVAVSSCSIVLTHSVICILLLQQQMRRRHQLVEELNGQEQRERSQVRSDCKAAPAASVATLPSANSKVNPVNVPIAVVGRQGSSP
jgi:hypothetical protein